MQFAGKSLLNIGRTGTLGNAVLRCFLDAEIAEIRALRRDGKQQQEMRLSHNSHKLCFTIGDVRCSRSLLDRMRGADAVFDAAMPRVGILGLSALCSVVCRGSREISEGASCACK